MNKLNRRAQSRRATLQFIDLDQAKSAVKASLRSAGSRRCYEHAIAELLHRYCSEPRSGFNHGVVTRFRMHLEALKRAA